MYSFSIGSRETRDVECCREDGFVYMKRVCIWVARCVNGLVNNDCIYWDHRTSEDVRAGDVQCFFFSLRAVGGV